MQSPWWLHLSLWVRDRLARRDDEDGQGLVEYALILAFVVIVVYFALRLLQPQISATLNGVSNAM